MVAHSIRKSPLPFEKDCKALLSPIRMIESVAKMMKGDRPSLIIFHATAKEN